MWLLSYVLFLFLISRYFFIVFFKEIIINLFPAGKISEKAVWRSVFFILWHCILNADSTKTHSFSVNFLAILPAGIYNFVSSISPIMCLSWKKVKVTFPSPRFAFLGFAVIKINENFVFSKLLYHKSALWVLIKCFPNFDFAKFKASTKKWNLPLSVLQTVWENYDCGSVILYCYKMFLNKETSEFD